MSEENPILSAATDLFRKHGLSFTMQDVAASLHISKKSIYKQYPSKETLLLALAEHGFQRIQEHKQKIMDSEMKLPEKLAAVLVAMPEDYRTLDFRHLSEVSEKYPSVFASIQHQLESGWEPIFSLLDQGIREGLFRPVHHTILQLIVTCSIDGFLDGRALDDAGIPYHEALQDLSELLVKGICVEHDLSQQ